MALHTTRIPSQPTLTSGGGQDLVVIIRVKSSKPELLDWSVIKMKVAHVEFVLWDIALLLPSYTSM